MRVIKDFNVSFEKLHKYMVEEVVVLEVSSSLEHSPDGVVVRNMSLAIPYEIEDYDGMLAVNLYKHSGLSMNNELFWKAMENRRAELSGGIATVRESAVNKEGFKTVYHYLLHCCNPYTDVSVLEVDEYEFAGVVNVLADGTYIVYVRKDGEVHA